MSFQLREDGYDVRDHQADARRPERKEMAVAGAEYRRRDREPAAAQDGYLQADRGQPAAYLAAKHPVPRHSEE